MENKKTNFEEVKVEKFFSRIWKQSVSKAVSWFLIGVFLFLIIILCMIPAQEIWAETEDAFMLMPTVLMIFTYLMISFRVAPYDQYTENQKSRFMAEILKYHPIDRKAVWKHKTKKLLVFLAKVTGVGLGLQILVSLIAYQSISYLNFVYIIGFMFVYPIGGMLVFDSIAKKVGE